MLGNIKKVIFSWNDRKLNIALIASSQDNLRGKVNINFDV